MLLPHPKPFEEGWAPEDCFFPFLPFCGVDCFCCEGWPPISNVCAALWAARAREQKTRTRKFLFTRPPLSLIRGTERIARNRHGCVMPQPGQRRCLCLVREANCRIPSADWENRYGDTGASSSHLI